MKITTFIHNVRGIDYSDIADLFNVLIIGPAGSGKTLLINRLCELFHDTDLLLSRFCRPQDYPANEYTLINDNLLAALDNIEKSEKKHVVIIDSLSEFKVDSKIANFISSRKDRKNKCFLTIQNIQHILSLYEGRQIFNNLDGIILMGKQENTNIEMLGLNLENTDYNLLDKRHGILINLKSGQKKKFTLEI